jgi:hypothetical protein
MRNFESARHQSCNCNSDRLHCAWLEYIYRSRQTRITIYVDALPVTGSFRLYFFAVVNSALLFHLDVHFIYSERMESPVNPSAPGIKHNPLV